jgi:hypothetical protein
MTARDDDDTPGTVFELPDTTDLAAVDRAEMEVIRLATQRRIGSREALRFSRMLDHRRRAIAARTFEQKMDEINERLKQRGRS